MCARRTGQFRRRVSPLIASRCRINRRYITSMTINCSGSNGIVTEFRVGVGLT